MSEQNTTKSDKDVQIEFEKSIIKNFNGNDFPNVPHIKEANKIHTMPEGHQESLLIAKGLCEIRYPNGEIHYHSANNIYKAMKEYGEKYLTGDVSMFRL